MPRISDLRRQPNVPEHGYLRVDVDLPGIPDLCGNDDMRRTIDLFCCNDLSGLDHVPGQHNLRRIHLLRECDMSG